MSLKTLLLPILLTGLLLSSCRKEDLEPRTCDTPPVLPEEKMGGINCSETRGLSQAPWAFTMQSELGADWISLVPVVFVFENSNQITDTAWADDLNTAIFWAKVFGYKVMLKPHLDVNRGNKHRGTYDLESEEEWLEFERQFSEFTLRMARIAAQQELEMFCVGTELRTFVKKRRAFWDQLIQEVKMIYDGPLTYAANWDEYGIVHFWDQMDYIGIDAYFPLLEMETPTVAKLEEAWRGDKRSLKNLHLSYCKPILFTEFGYRSANYCAWEHWNLEDDMTNMEAQSNGYEAFYRTFWEEDWVAGAFAWDWLTHRLPEENDKWTVQDKPAASVMKSWLSN